MKLRDENQPLPQEWNETRLRRLVELNPGKSEVSTLPDDLEVTFLGMENVKVDGKLDLSEKRKISDVYSGYTYFRDGDVLVAKITPCFENGKGALAKGLRNGLGFGSTEFHVLRVGSKLDSRFLEYITHSYPFRVKGAKMMTGAAGQKRVPEDFISDMNIPVPPLSVQRAIANFLDQKTAVIDDLIAKKERLIELLDEKRAALINQAVTRGLDPDVPMKDSGVPWIGEIPAHWELVQLKYLCSMKSGEGITSRELDDGARYPVYGGNGIRGKTYKYTHDGNFLLIGRQGALCGNVHKAVGRFFASEHAVVATPRDIASVDWLKHLLKAMDLNQYSVAAAQPGLAVERIRDLYVPVPTTSEQINIGEHLNDLTFDIGQLAALVGRQIDSFRQYRQSLITAAVTGQTVVALIKDLEPTNSSKRQSFAKESV